MYNTNKEHNIKMEFISNIVNDNEITTAKFLSNDEVKMNLFRRAILSEVETYTIDIVVFDVNETERHDEIIAHRMGQLVIDNDLFTPESNENLIFHMDVVGPKRVTTNDIQGLPFKYETFIAELSEDRRLVCDVIVKLGTSKTHVKWRPVAQFVFEEDQQNGIFNFKFKNIGMLNSEEIIRRAVNKMQISSLREPQTIYSAFTTQ